MVNYGDSILNYLNYGDSILNYHKIIKYAVTIIQFYDN